MKQAVDTVIILRILKKLTTPFNKTEAFKLGVIDKNGKVLVAPKDRDQQQKQSMTMLDRLVFNLKRLLSKVPGGQSQLGSYVAALALVREYVEEKSNKETVGVLMEKLQNHNIIPAQKHDLSTQEGFMDAWEEEMMREMFSGAAIGGAFDGAQSNANTNASGMAAPNSPVKKKKGKLENILRHK